MHPFSKDGFAAIRVKEVDLDILVWKKPPGCVQVKIQHETWSAGAHL
jgi:hypothetical protein